MCPEDIKSDFRGVVQVPDNRTSHLNVNNCMFQLNSVAGEHNQTFGGALGFEGNKSKVRIANSSFDSNAARAYGGAIGGARPMNLDIIDSFFSKDTAGIAGGAIYTEVCCHKFILTKVMSFVLVL